jgi:hypothetical protein
VLFNNYYKVISIINYYSVVIIAYYEDLCMVLSASYHCLRKPTGVSSLQAGVDSTQDPAFLHCEEERGEMIKQFKKDHPSITELMGKGILAIGFPDSS